jgi:hydroxyacylglutathione hydrolase
MQYTELFDDNYCYFIHCNESGHTTCVDPGEALPVLTALKQWGWKLHTILLTHHHDDHIGGAEVVAAATGAIMYGYKDGLHRLPKGVLGIANGDSVPLGSSTRAHAIHTPGHTVDAITWHAPTIKALFVGDTLFAMGCGRLFEGTPLQMHSSLTKLSQLAGATRIFCGHGMFLPPTFIYCLAFFSSLLFSSLSLCALSLRLW